MPNTGHFFYDTSKPPAVTPVVLLSITVGLCNLRGRSGEMLGARRG